MSAMGGKRTACRAVVKPLHTAPSKNLCSRAMSAAVASEREDDHFAPLRVNDTLTLKPAFGLTAT
jgi:hypothetical protein